MPKAQTYVTPVGTVKFPNTEFQDGTEIGMIKFIEDYKEGDKVKWSLGLAFDPKEGKEILDAIEEMESKVKGKNFQVIKQNKDKNEDTDEFEPDGQVLVNFKSFFPPNICDSKKNTVQKNLGWGTKARIAFTMKECDFKKKKGVTCYMRAIQVTEMQESTDMSEFGEIDGGYVQQENTSVTSGPSNAEDIAWEE